MTPQEIRLLSSEKIRAKIESLKTTAKLLEAHPANEHDLMVTMKTDTAKKIAELEDVLFSRG